MEYAKEGMTRVIAAVQEACLTYPDAEVTFTTANINNQLVIESALLGGIATQYVDVLRCPGHRNNSLATIAATMISMNKG